jgi:hypothetical protein
MANRPAPANRNKGAVKSAKGMNKMPKFKTASKRGARPSAVKNFLKKYSQAMR